jgi:hypothetical protein
MLTTGHGLFRRIGLASIDLLHRSYSLLLDLTVSLTTLLHGYKKVERRMVIPLMAN